MADAREKALKVLEDNKIGVLATVSDGKPYASYMTFFSEGFVLYTLTDKRTHKVAQVDEDPDGFVLLGYEEGLLNKQYVEIQAKISTTDDQSLIDHLWSAYMNVIFDGKDDPNILILQIKPEQIHLRNTKDDEVMKIDLT